MGCFPNGSAGSDYQNKYCSKCKHDQDNGCSVYLAHLLFNYDQHDNDKLASVLNLLIPIDMDGVSNEKCTMFLSTDAEAG